VRYSLIVPYFRTPEITRLCLYSIFKLARGEPEVIVVDNAPGSAESAMLLDFPAIKLLNNATQLRGSAANFQALDLGLARATNDLVGLIHSDTLFLQEGWDLECFARLAAGGIAALGTFEREANPFRPLRQRVRDRVKHWLHRDRPARGAQGKLMLHFLLTRRSTLERIGFVFSRDGHIGPEHFSAAGQAVETLSLVEVSRLIWHTSNITGLLTGQIDDPALAATYRDKRERLLGEPRIRALFGPVLPKS
jgi:hypothetical protein